MNIVDSTLWLEFYAGTEAGSNISSVIENSDELLVPTNIKHNCLLWTQDKHFYGLNSVNYFEKMK